MTIIYALAATVCAAVLAVIAPRALVVWLVGSAFAWLSIGLVWCVTPRRRV